MHGEDENLEPGMAFAQDADELDARSCPGSVRSVTTTSGLSLILTEAKCGGGVRRLAADFDAFGRLDAQSDALTQERMVIDKENA
jgi:hypothetical protein